MDRKSVEPIRELFDHVKERAVAARKTHEALEGKIFPQRHGHRNKPIALLDCSNRPYDADIFDRYIYDDNKKGDPGWTAFDETRTKVTETLGSRYSDNWGKAPFASYYNYLDPQLLPFFMNFVGSEAHIKGQINSEVREFVVSDKTRGGNTYGGQNEKPLGRYYAIVHLLDAMQDGQSGLTPDMTARFNAHRDNMIELIEADQKFLIEGVDFFHIGKEIGLSHKDFIKNMKAYWTENDTAMMERHKKMGLVTKTKSAPTANKKPQP